MNFVECVFKMKSYLAITFYAIYGYVLSGDPFIS